MKFIDNIICPISDDKIDGNLNRVTVFLISLLLSIYLYSGLPYLLIFVTLDYAIRAFDKAQFSPIKRLARGIAKLISLRPKLTDQAPKQFATRVGFLFSGLASIFYVISLQSTSFIIAGVLLTFTILDSVFNICVGCIIYNYIVFPFYKRKLSL